MEGGTFSVFLELLSSSESFRIQKYYYIFVIVTMNFTQYPPDSQVYYCQYLKKKIHSIVNHMLIMN